MQIMIIGIIAVVVVLFIFILLNLKGTSQKYIEQELEKMANTAIRTQNNIVKNNEDILKETADKTADINKDAVKTIASSIKDGLTEDDDK